jgi:hypothetical protein
VDEDEMGWGEKNKMRKKGKMMRRETGVRKERKGK